MLSKWLHKSLDTAGDVNTDTSLESFIDDPTDDQHLIKAVRGVRAFIERNADGKSLDDFFGALLALDTRCPSPASTVWRMLEQPTSSDPK